MLIGLLASWNPCILLGGTSNDAVTVENNMTGDQKKIGLLQGQVTSLLGIQKNGKPRSRDF